VTVAEPGPSSARRLPAFLPAVAFFFSGTAALVYQVSWQRILILQTGVGVASVSLIVASFMAGLGLGSFLGGRVSLRLSTASAARWFVSIEVAIAVFGAASIALFHDLLSLRLGWIFSEPIRGALVQALTLLLPTTLMGMSLPILVRAVVRTAEGAARDVGALYGINMLGAAAGAWLTPWMMIPSYGLDGSVWRAACLNLAAGLMVWWSSRSWTQHPLVPTSAAPSLRSPPLLWMWLYAGTGFVALSLEIVWFRVFDVAARGTSYTFGTLLAIYLLGSGSGAFLASFRAHRIERPLLTFLLLQAALLSYSGLILGLIGRAPLTFPGLAFMNGYWRSAEGFDLGAAAFGETLLIYGLFPLILFGPPTVLMGLSFAVLHRAVQDDPETSGSKTGALQAANIFGCVTGSLLTGLVFLESLGSADTLRLLVALGLGFLTLAVLRYPSDWKPKAALPLLMLSVAAVPRSGDLWKRFHGAETLPSHIQEDASAVAGIVDKGGFFRVYVNGHSHSWMPYGDIHSLLGLLPAMMHDAPLDVAVVGLGSADTAWASGAHPLTRSITVFEIARPQPAVLRAMAESSSDAVLSPLRRFLDDSRVSIRLGDARNALLHETTLYDLIEADPLRPSMAGSGNLYSVEFYRLLKTRLKPGGLATVWAPTERARRTFLSAFDHVVRFPDDILVGSPDPIPLRHRRWRRQVEAAAVVAYLGIPDLVTKARDALGAGGPLPPPDSPGLLNLDLFPRDEFRSPDR